MTTQIQLRGGTTSEWTASNPILAQREPGVEFAVNGIDLVGIKFGNGTQRWNDLPYGGSSGGGGGGGDVELLWSNIVGKPATFPPTLGSTGSTAAAGNHTHSNAQILAALGYTPESTSNKGAPNGYAPLGGDGKVPAANLPAASAGGVTSVAGRSGAVSLTASDAPGINSEVQNALNAKVGSTTIKTIRTLTKADYAAISSPDNGTLYLGY